MENNIPTLSDFKTILKRNWISDGYGNKKYEQERWSQANKILKEFYKTECDPPVKPLGIEFSFSFNLPPFN